MTEAAPILVMALLAITFLKLKIGKAMWHG